MQQLSLYVDVRYNNVLAELNDYIGGLSHLRLNVITFRTLLRLGPNVITFRPSTSLPPPLAPALAEYPTSHPKERHKPKWEVKFPWLCYSVTKEKWGILTRQILENPSRNNNGTVTATV